MAFKCLMGCGLWNAEGMCYERSNGPKEPVYWGRHCLFATFLKPQRSPKTGQWLSPENRPTRIASGTLIPAGSCSLRGHGQCLERREETASLSTGTAGMVATTDPEGHPHPS